MRAVEDGDLRRGLLAVAVLDDVDLVPRSDGVVLPGTPDLHVSEPECRQALAGAPPLSPRGRRRLACWLRARRRAADLTAAELASRLRPVGLPVGHDLHPGPAWVRERVLGGALELGLGAAGLDPADPDGVVLLPPPALPKPGLDPVAAWSGARSRLEQVGAVAVDLLAADGRGQLRPVGGCDVVTLLGARALRQVLAAAGGGLCAVAAPMRRRGWSDLTLLDPAFAAAAAAATDPEERGFPRPVLVTADEVALVPAGGRYQPAAGVPAPRASERLPRQRS